MSNSAGATQHYDGAGDGQCLAIKGSDGERCTNGVYGSRVVCGTHMNASDVTVAPETTDREFYLCPECGWQTAEWEQPGGDPPYCSSCGVEFPIGSVPFMQSATGKGWFDE